VIVCKSDGTVVKQFLGLSQPMGVAIGDYDNGGLNEIAITETYPVGKVTVYKSDGTTIVGNWTGRGTPTGVAIGDFNNDGKNELVFTEVSRLTIVPESIVPEFPSFPVVLAFTAATLVPVIIRKKRKLHAKETEYPEKRSTRHYPCFG
jgi:hypothetical protein